VTMDQAELLRRAEARQNAAPPELEDVVSLGIFAGMPEKVRPKVVEKARKYLRLVDFEKGEAVLRLGAYSDSAFFVVSGGVEVLLPGGDKEAAAPVQVARPKKQPARYDGGATMLGVSTNSSGSFSAPILGPMAPIGGRILLGPGEIFGEMSALSRYPASATVQADEPTRLLQVILPGLRLLLSASKEFKKFLDDRYRERALTALLRTVPLFEKLEGPVLERLRQRAELVSFAPGQVIEEEGGAAASLYLVRGGYVKLSVRAGASDLAVTYLRTGDYAGEGLVFGDMPWPFRMQALEHVELVKLELSEVREALAPHPEVRRDVWKSSVDHLRMRGATLENPISSRHVQMAMDTGLIHGESVLLIDLRTCTQCDECVRGCADAHGGVPRFVREGETYRNWLIPTACYQCTDPVCMIDCPTGAISRNLGTLEVTINGHDHATRPCIGCGNCVKRCPWGNIVFHHPGMQRSDGKPVEVATKCDLCVGRAEGPACVQMCPHGCAIRVSFKDLGRVAETLA